MTDAWFYSAPPNKCYGSITNKQTTKAISHILAHGEKSKVSSRAADVMQCYHPKLYAWNKIRMDNPIPTKHNIGEFYKNYQTSPVFI
jgi:hypothetical protein